MRKAIAVVVLSVLGLMVAASISFSHPGEAWANVDATSFAGVPETRLTTDGGFEVEVLVHGRPLEEYYARGKRYVEALEGAEYEVRVRNPLGVRVAVALSVDGLNTIDARRSSASDASKWVIGPYQSITVSGWQMSSARARRFYFTNERNSYGAKIGQTSNLGVITAAFFRERRPIGVVVPRPRNPRPVEDGSLDGRSESKEAPSASAGGEANRADGQARKSQSYPAPDDDYAATGIGRNVRNDVYWINMDLESRPSAEVTVRYEYHDALVRLGIIPRSYPRPDTLRRRERATGFEDRRYIPEP